MVPYMKGGAYRVSLCCYEPHMVNLKKNHPGRARGVKVGQDWLIVKDFQKAAEWQVLKIFFNI